MKFFRDTMGQTTIRKSPNFGLTLRLSVTLFLAMATLSVIASWYSDKLEASSGLSAASSRIEQEQVVDPDIIDSEFNHRAAGWALVAMALLIVCGYASPKFAFLQKVWPFIFIAVGIFLAVWSDKEIWPRGHLSWTWLIHHDAEARQHKIYAVLLIMMGILEYLRATGKLTRIWQRWAFPMLAVFGAVLLLFHDHGGGSGLPPGWDKAEKEQRIAKMRQEAGLPPLPAEPEATTSMAMGTANGMSHDMGGMSHDMSGMSHDAGEMQEKGHGGHVMTPGMLHIQRQHLWYTSVGIAIALLKFLSDGNFFRFRWLPYSWPFAMAVLGLLLTGYTE
jgi:hypothetical protein